LALRLRGFDRISSLVGFTTDRVRIFSRLGERVEREHSEPPPNRESINGTLEKCLQAFDLFVDRNTQRLKDPGRRMDPPPGAADAPGHDGRQLRRGGDPGPAPLAIRLERRSPPYS
jgi:hypothetical protein